MVDDSDKAVKIAARGAACHAPYNPDMTINPLESGSQAPSSGERRRLQRMADASFIPWGPPDGEPPPPTLVETFGEYEAEYAAIRKGVGLFEAAHKGGVEVTGADRQDFLHRMITNDVNGLSPGDAKRAFLLNNKGRIVADLLVLHQADRTLLEVDRLQSEAVVGTLDNYLFAEDVALRSANDAWVKISLHGPAGAKLLRTAMGVDVSGMAPFTHRTITNDGTNAVVYRCDETGSLGLHLLLEVDGADQVYAKLAEAVGGLVPDVEPGEDGSGGPKREIIGRGIGWLAYNTARIEAHSAVFRIDFGPDTLPHETGKHTLAEAVSFTKGCYLGQEVVARMQSLGHPKKMLCGLKLEDDRLPIAGVGVLQADGSAEIGAVTSSAVSPMLGGQAVALAMLKWGQHRAGTTVLVPAEGSNVQATVVDEPFVGQSG